MDQNNDMGEQQQQKRKRGPNKRKEKPVVPLEVQFDKNGKAIGENFQRVFSSYLAATTRLRISYLLDDWKKVPVMEKDALWLDIKDQHNIKDDFAKETTLLHCSSAFKRFKTKLRKYMDNDLLPYNEEEEYSFITADKWEEFCDKENTPERRAQREQGRLNALKQKNYAHLGRSGYRGHIKKWEKERNDPNKRTVYHDIDDTPKRHWVLSRTKPNEEGKRTLCPDTNPTLIDNIVKTEKVGGDAMREHVGKEHGGRTEGVWESFRL